MARSSMLAPVLLSIFVCSACSDDVAGDEADGTDSADSADSADTTAGTDTGDTGGPAEGWEQAHVDTPVELDCDMSEDEMIAAGAPGLSFGDASLYVGYQEYPQNIDTVLARYDGGTQTYCQYHDLDGPDAFGHSLTWDGGDFAYVVYTVNGSGSSLTQAAGWLSDYAPGPITGANVFVPVLGRVETAGGTLQAATFMLSVTADEKVDALTPSAAPTVLQSGEVELEASAASSPIDADAASAMSCEGAGPFAARYRFAGDLAELSCADASGCSPQSPC